MSTKLLIREFLSDSEIPFIENEPLSRHTTFKIGGCADFFVTAPTKTMARLVYVFCKDNNIPLTLMGKGSNLLVSDSGVEGIVMTMSGVDSVCIEGEYITAGAGMSLHALCNCALQNGLAGLEFAYGIPGSVGGAVFMNAGAYGGEINDVIESAEALLENGEIATFTREEMCLTYRDSIFKRNGAIILSAKFKLKKGDTQEIRRTMDGYIHRRRDKQPLDFPSAGSTFKRPPNNFAGTLIEKAGLKGLTVGGAMVSQKHAGFIINAGGATCCDVLSLIEKVQSEIKQSNGINLEPEVIFIGRK